MLSVKLIQPNGHEQIFPAAHVAADPVDPATDPTANRRGAMDVLVWGHQEGEEEPLRFGGYGTLYVMNHTGQTIAKYWLGSGEGQTP